jgi:hypothetical protein
LATLRVHHTVIESDKVADDLDIGKDKAGVECGVETRIVRAIAERKTSTTFVKGERE